MYSIDMCSSCTRQTIQGPFCPSSASPYLLTPASAS